MQSLGAVLFSGKVARPADDQHEAVRIWMVGKARACDHVQANIVIGCCSSGLIGKDPATCFSVRLEAREYVNRPV